MLRYITSSLVACALGVIGVFAQEPQSNPPQEQESRQEAAASTLTGCLQEAKTTDGSTAYVLNKAEGGNASLYLLSGPPESELAGHVNHKMEVKGQVQEPGGPPSAEGSQGGAVRPPVVQVESMKMVADSCQ